MLNISSDLYKSGWLELIFKNRNKNYGAYVLRSQSSGNTLRALSIAVPFFILVFAAPMINRYFHHKQAIVPALKTDRIIDLTIAPPVYKKPEPVKKLEILKAEPAEKKIKVIKPISNPVVVEKAVIADPPTLEDIAHTAAGPVAQSGIDTELGSVPAEGSNMGTGLGINGENGKGEDTGIHNVGDIQVYPEFEGGMKAWAKFIQRNLRYPAMAQEAGVKGKVFISFVIEKDGSVSNVTILKGIGYGCDEEAVRVIGKSPKWKPGRQNDQNVRVRYNMPLSFTIN